MPQYKNTGARFPRDDGESWIERGEVFEPTDNELARRKYKLVRWHEADEPARSAAPAEEEEAPREFDSDQWPLKMHPERYLEVHPDGPNAELARELLNAED